jgi:hypothetical protein
MRGEIGGSTAGEKDFWTCSKQFIIVNVHAELVKSFVKVLDYKTWYNAKRAISLLFLLVPSTALFQPP